VLHISDDSSDCFEKDQRRNIIQLRNGNLAASNINKTIYIYNIDLETPIRELVGHTESTFSLLELQNGNLLSECSEIKLWDVNSGTCLRTMRNEGKIATMSQLQDGTVIITDEYAITVWDVDTGTKIKTVKTKAYAYYSITEISKGVIVTCSDEQDICIYNIAEEITLIRSMPTNSRDLSYASIRLANGNFVTVTNEELYLWSQSGDRLETCKCNETGIEFMNKIAEVEPV
jgi:WD40 repeat protein